jgi:hypothetical protein
MSNRLSRRRLLSAGAVVSAGAVLSGQPAAAQAGAPSGRPKTTPFSNVTGDALLPPDRIGLMLYTVRDQIQSLGFAKVFETIAGMGFNAVEFAGYSQGTGPITTKQIRRLLTANGLTPVGSHGNLDDAAIAAAVDLDLPYTGTAFEVPSGADTAAWEQLAADYNAFGERAAKHGVKGYLHMHGPAFAPVADNPEKQGWTSSWSRQTRRSSRSRWTSIGRTSSSPPSPAMTRSTGSGTTATVSRCSTSRTAPLDRPAGSQVARSPTSAKATSRSRTSSLQSGAHERAGT